MVADSISQTTLTVVLAVGAPLLVGLFFAEGLVVGKILQPPAVFIAYVAVAQPSTLFLCVLSIGCILAATLGQWALYRGFNEDAPEFIGLRRRVPHLQALPVYAKDRVGKRQLRFVERGFERHGAIGVCLLNIVPGIRGLSAIPAGLSAYPRGRFLVASTLGNALYTALLIAVAYGILQLPGLLG